MTKCRKCQSDMTIISEIFREPDTIRSHMKCPGCGYVLLQDYEMKKQRYVETNGFVIDTETNRVVFGSGDARV